MIVKELRFKKSAFSAYDAEVVAKLASSFKSDMYLEHEHLRANLKSIIGLISTRLKENDHFTIIADGEDEEDAADAIENYFNQF